jgi:hypothetical protein
MRITQLLSILPAILLMVNAESAQERSLQPALRSDLSERMIPPYNKIQFPPSGLDLQEAIAV